jgi:hypothetical protein
MQILQLIKLNYNNKAEFYFNKLKITEIMTGNNIIMLLGL